MAPLTDALRRLVRRAPEAKASATARLIAFHSAGRPVWTPRDYRALAREGYQRNAVVYRAVRLVTESAASLPWLLKEGEREIATHPLLDLLKRPNPRQSGAELMEAAYGHLMVAGNAYLEAAEVDGAVRELHALRPDRMRVVPGADGWPEAYEYEVAGRKLRFAQDQRQSPVLHLTLFHPTDDHYGLSPLEAAQVSLDVHNAASAWNKALLDNAARPSGALVYEGETGLLAREQYERLKRELEEHFAGPGNAGRPLLLEGGLEWRSMGLNPRDMDFIEAKNMAAREIALAFGVPPMLLGIPGDNTYSNYQEANRAFWRQTVLPLANRMAQALAQWLEPSFGEVELSHDLDAVPALSADRDSLWKRVSEADFLSEDEKRVAVGYGARETP